MKFIKIQEEFKSKEAEADHELKHNQGKVAKDGAVRQKDGKYKPEDTEDIPEVDVKKTGMIFFKDHEDWDGNPYEYNSTLKGLTKFTKDADTLADYAVHCGTGKHDDPYAPIVGYRSFNYYYTKEPECYHVYNKITGQYIVFTIDDDMKSGYKISTYHLRNQGQYQSYYLGAEKEVDIVGCPAGLKYKRGQFVDEIPKNPLHVSKTNFWKKIEERLIDGLYFPKDEFDAIHEQSKIAAEEEIIHRIEKLINGLKKLSGEELQTEIKNIQDYIAEKRDEVPDLEKRITNIKVLKDTSRSYFLNKNVKKKKKK